jgi:hypothetical protein
MSIPAFIARTFEHRTHSIYDHFPRPMDEIFKDSKVPLPLKFSAVFAAFANFKFPLKFSAFRSLVPDSVWQEHFRFRYTRLRTGFWPIFSGEGELDYELRIGMGWDYGHHVVYIAAKSDFEWDEGNFTPPLDSSVERFTLCHPFLQPELHDPGGIYLCRG